MDKFEKNPFLIIHPYEKEMNAEILCLITSRINNNAFYTEKCVKYILQQISNHNFVTGYTENLIKQFRKKPCVNLEEKKRYHINTRQKINKTFFDLLTEEGKHQGYVLSDLRNIIYSSKSKILNKYHLFELKSLDIKEVEISCCEDDNTCMNRKKYCNRRYLIDEVPELPLEGCTAGFCVGSYLPVINFD